MGEYYILIENIPVVCENMMEWAKWNATHKFHVKDVLINDVRISTVFLGINHQYGDGLPLLFETMVFGGKLDGEMDRYSTWKEAETGHDRIVQIVKNSIQAGQIIERAINE